MGSAVRHYIEMVVAMLAGMVTLHPAWAAAVGWSEVDWLVRTEVEALAMATAMAVPMAGWMLLRGHRAALVVEMCLVMYVGFAALFPLLWSELIDRGTLLALGHVAMLVLMALAMARRPQEYAARH